MFYFGRFELGINLLLLLMVVEEFTSAQLLASPRHKHCHEVQNEELKNGFLLLDMNFIFSSRSYSILQSYGLSQIGFPVYEWSYRHHLRFNNIQKNISQSEQKKCESKERST